MKIPFPRISYKRLRIIIEAYSEIDQEVVKIKKLAEFLAGSVHLTDLHGPTKFLVSINMLEKTMPRGSYKVTTLCKELGHAIKTKEGKKEAQILREIIGKNLALEKIKQRIEYLEKISGSIDLDNLKREVIRLCGWEENSKTNKHIYNESALTIIDIFKESKFLTVTHNSSLMINHDLDTVEFINSSHINELIKLNPTKEFDLTRLICYCRQVNDNYSSNNYEAVAFLSRAIIHHVPPIFGQPNFESLGVQTSKRNDSFKKSCVNLQNSLKHIVDELIHRPISNAETPLAQQEINFAQDLNRLIRGVIDRVKSLERNK